MRKTGPLFVKIEMLLLSASHPEMCTDDVIKSIRNIHQDICISLDAVCFKMRMKSWLHTSEDFDMQMNEFLSLDNFWIQAGHDCISKGHGILFHAFLWTNLMVA